MYVRLLNYVYLYKKILDIIVVERMNSPNPLSLRVVSVDVYVPIKPKFDLQKPFYNFPNKTQPAGLFVQTLYNRRRQNGF